jgi:hypothetical protein
VLKIENSAVFAPIPSASVNPGDFRSGERHSECCLTC